MKGSLSAPAIVDLSDFAPKVVAADLTGGHAATDAQLLSVYQTLRGEQRRLFFHQHDQALMRALEQSHRAVRAAT